MKQAVYFIIFLLISTSLKAQFPGPVGTPGTDAIPKDSSIFIGWAAGCSVVRGYKQIGLTDSGYASFGDSTLVLDHADNNGVVSLGDGGHAIVTFNGHIYNGPGHDFAIFENAFHDAFLEYAFVEVSSDGINYYRYPATSNIQTNTQIGGFHLDGDATKINNLAGKYRAGYGTPFDLNELADTPGLNVDSITHIKIIDVVGSIDTNYATYDQHGNPINDPFPTPFPSSGFDLDAVGVINGQIATGLEFHSATHKISVFPNPVNSNGIVFLKGKDLNEKVTIQTIEGSRIYSGYDQKIRLSNLATGVYLVKIQTVKKTYIQKIVVQ